MMNKTIRTLFLYASNYVFIEKESKHFAIDKPTALRIAVSTENQEMVDFLIDAGASKALVGNYSQTFEEMAASKNIILKE